MDLAPSMSTLATLAAAAEREELEASSSTDEPGKQMKRHYIKMLHKVVDQSDIILFVLDARDPEGCRSKMVEDEVLRQESNGKKLIFVLNKIGAPSGTCAVDAF